MFRDIYGEISQGVKEKLSAVKFSDLIGRDGRTFRSDRGCCTIIFRIVQTAGPRQAPAVCFSVQEKAETSRTETSRTEKSRHCLQKAKDFHLAICYNGCKSSVSGQEKLRWARLLCGTGALESFGCCPRGNGADSGSFVSSRFKWSGTSHLKRGIFDCNGTF